MRDQQSNYEVQRTFTDSVYFFISRQNGIVKNLISSHVETLNLLCTTENRINLVANKSGFKITSISAPKSTNTNQSSVRPSVWNNDFKIKRVRLSGQFYWILFDLPIINPAFERIPKVLLLAFQLTSEKCKSKDSQ